MSNFAERITDALDILKYDGAVQDTLAELPWQSCGKNGGSGPDAAGRAV